MKSQHPTEGQLSDLLRGDMPKDEVRAIVRHLLTGCSECLRVTRKLWNLGVLPPYLKVLVEEADAAVARSRRGLLEADGR